MTSSSTANGGQRADIGVTGMAVMGGNLARNFARHGHAVAIHNRTTAKTRSIYERFGHEGTFVPSDSTEAFVASLERPRRIIIMVKAGPGTDAVIDELVPLLEDGDIVVDAGNAHFVDTQRREQALRERGLHFVGTGVSGGEEGALLGPSIMPGGSPESYEALGPLLEDISAKVDGTPCCVYVGRGGAGHFVKMVHNGIEYADMQLIAEAYDLLRSGVDMPVADIAAVFKEWNSGDLESFLIETTATVLSHVDAETGQPYVDVVRDEASRRAPAAGRCRSRSTSACPSRVSPRRCSPARSPGRLGQRQAARGLPGVSGRLSGADADRFADDVRRALYASKVVAYAQGFDQINVGSRDYDWGIDPGAMAMIWRGGCIIRARFLERIKQAYDDQPELPSLLLAPYFQDAVGQAQDSWRRGRIHLRHVGDTRSRVRDRTVLLRRAASRAAARRPHPGTA